jgi:hypothetical protein
LAVRITAELGCFDVNWWIQHYSRENPRGNNDQLRSGQNAVPAPGICAIYQESLEATGGRMLLAALFGDLTIPIALNPIQPGTPFLGRNGILSATKNRAVNAVRYVTLGSEELVVLNPYARFPIASIFFRTPVWVESGGIFTLSQMRKPLKKTHAGFD